MKQKPKILLITNLYPESADHSILDVTRALHNFTTCWSKSADLMVIRPEARFNIRSFNTKNLFNRSVRNEFDGIIVYTLTYTHMPRLRIFMHNSFHKFIIRTKFLPDIIISHRDSHFLVGDRLSHLLSVPHIAGIHHSCLKNIDRYKDILLRTDSIACRSASIKRLLLERLPKLSDKVFIANSGIGKEKILKKADFIEKPNSTINGLKLISVCGLIPLKHIDIVLLSLSRLSSCINWHYTIIGDGPERESLEELAKSLAIDDKVTFMGFIENSDIYNYLDKSNVFIMISSPETFGLAYLEAMARGNIVIGTKGWGIDGIVTDGVNGFLCEEVTADNLVEKIMKFMSLSSSEYREMLNNIYMTIIEYTDEKMAQEYLDEIEKCMQRHRKNTIQSKRS